MAATFVGVIEGMNVDIGVTLAPEAGYIRVDTDLDEDDTGVEVIISRQDAEGLIALLQAALAMDVLRTEDEDEDDD